MKTGVSNYPQNIDCGIVMPLILTLPDNPIGNKIICKNIVRSLPGKRLVCLANWGKDDVFAKIFFDPKHAQRYWQREQSGVQALLDGNVLTPPLLYSGPALSLTNELAPRTIYLLVTKRIAPSITLKKAWEMADEAERLTLLESIMAVFVNHHRAGLMHKDTHFGNFLVQEKNIFTLDGDQIEIERRSVPLDRKRSLHNLGLLFGQLTPDYDNCIDEVFLQYRKGREWDECSTDVVIIKAKTNDTREYRKRKFLKKIFRTCSAFVYRNSNRQTAVYDRGFDSLTLRRLTQDPDSFLNGTACTLLKRGNSATVGVIDIDGRALVIKRYNIKGPWHAFRRALQRSRAAISWRNAHLLNFYGIATPTPVALIEKRLGPLRRTSYFISTYAEGVDCAHYFNDNNSTIAERTDMANKLITLFAKLAHARISHGDMKATNIIISKGDPALIDLDAAYQHSSRSVFRRSFSRDIQRFLKNWDDNENILKLFKQRLLRLHSG